MLVLFSVQLSLKLHLLGVIDDVTDHCRCDACDEEDRAKQHEQIDELIKMKQCSPPEPIYKLVVVPHFVLRHRIDHLVGLQWDEVPRLF